MSAVRPATFLVMTGNAGLSARIRRIDAAIVVLKNRILLENYFLPGDLEGLIEASSSITIASDITRASTM